MGKEQETESDIGQIVKMALLKKDTSEQEEFEREIKKIINFASEVQSIKTDEKTNTGEKVNVFRSDTVDVEAKKYREKMLEQAPKQFKNWFLSKKIL